MPLFRKRPVEIHAWPASELIAQAKHDWSKLPEGVREAYDKSSIIFGMQSVEIHTLEGWMRANGDDWIIQGVQKELYPCKPDIFAATYDQVESQ